MITGFEEYTKSLSKEEQRIAPVVVNMLSSATGQQMAITAKKISKAVKKLGRKMKGPRIRKMIHELRVNQIVPNLIASSNGYYVSTDQKEKERYIKSLDERIAAIQAVRRSFTISEQPKQLSVTKRKKVGRPFSYPYNELMVGESIKVDRITMAAQANLWARRNNNGRKFSCKTKLDGSIELTRIK